MTVRVLVAGDSLLLREAIGALLAADELHVVGTADLGLEATRMARELQPDIALLHYRAPDAHGLDGLARLRDASPGTKPLLITSDVGLEAHSVLEALGAGVRGYVLETQPAEHLLLAVREVSSGAIYLSPAISDIVARAWQKETDGGAYDPLTPRTREILCLIAMGKTTKEIAQALGISVKTADTHRMRMMGRLKIHGVAGLVRYAIRRGLVQP